MMDQTNKIRVFREKDIDRLLPVAEAVGVVEKAFRSYAKGKMRMPPKVYLDLPEFSGDFRAMPAYSSSAKMASLKWVNSHDHNRKHKLPAVMATLLLNDAKTGLPLALFDGTSLTRIRTGAAGGVAAKFLARKDAKRAAFVGAGIQAVYQALALLSVRPGIQELSIYDPSKSAMADFKKQISSVFNGNIQEFRNAQLCVTGADMITTTTPSKRPILLPEWISPGCHINAIGADAPEKQELDPAILRRAKIIVDDVHQASHSGEINVALRTRRIQKARIGGTLGQVILGEKPGRTDQHEITVFDSTGLAIQDLACAIYVYERFDQRISGQDIEL